jgi:hypothetical protein
MGDNKIRKERYIGQVWMAINYYKQQLSRPTIIIGDFK